MIDVGTPDYVAARRALTLGALLVFGNLYLLQPLLPTLTETFSVSASEANWAHAGVFLGLALALLPWAVLSERVGRYRVICLSLMAIPPVGALGAMADSLWALVVARVVLGGVLAGFTAVAVAYMAEEFSPSALALAVGGFVAANSVGGILSRLVGGALGQWLGWQGMLLTSSAVGVLVVLGALRWLPQEREFRPHTPGWMPLWRAIFGHLMAPRLVLAMLLGGVNFALFVNQFSVMGFRLVAPPHQLPVAVSAGIFLCYLTGTLTSALSGLWSQRFGPLSGMAFGVLLALFGLVLARLETLWAILLGLLLISAGAFLVHALAYAWVGREARQARAGATALYLVHYYLGGSLGGFWLLWWWQERGWDGVILGSLVLYLVMLLLVWGLKHSLGPSVERPGKKTPA
ncbi:MFS transporter [Ferrimonas gelatinilytica]|uniref:MFS transporter n=1 Tax=Ferrimonas gelatinilytica TaxID=1255257 RepID=A0ABP9SDX7_9GAMM